MIRKIAQIFPHYFLLTHFSLFIFYFYWTNINILWDTQYQQKHINAIWTDLMSYHCFQNRFFCFVCIELCFWLNRYNLFMCDLYEFNYCFLFCIYDSVFYLYNFIYIIVIIDQRSWQRITSYVTYHLPQNFFIQ